MICGQPGSTSGQVVDINPGDKIGMYWQHVIGGAQFANDKDNPIAHSHKGPVMAYLAKVDDASKTGINGLKWFKIHEDAFDPSNKQWGVDRMLSGNGWAFFNFPTCVAPGQYILRGEIIALHSAKTAGSAQFYQVCRPPNRRDEDKLTPPSRVLRYASAAREPSLRARPSHSRVLIAKVRFLPSMTIPERY